MGNSATKEQRQSPSRMRSADLRRASSPAITSPTSSSLPHPPDEAPTLYGSRQARSSRPDLSALFSITSGSHGDTSTSEGRRESKQEREARKLERERVNRERDRERSMQEEHVDGGYLVTQGVYTGIEDYSKGIVRQLMIERRIAPFWRGLNDFSESWTEHQLVAAARALPIPAADEVPAEDPSNIFPLVGPGKKEPEKKLSTLSIPHASRSQSSQSDASSNISPLQPTFADFPTSVSSNPVPSGFRGRAKTLAALTTSSKNPQSEMMPREMHLPKDPYVSGQRLEAYLYKDASECPICFLYYPPYLNKTRCCDQAICSECFVQIKRPEPHPPEHADPSAPPPPATDEPEDPDSLVSEPATCPFCKQPEFGITYEPPSFRKGLTYVNQASTHSLAGKASAMSSSSSLVSAKSGGQASSMDAPRRRTQSLSATAPSVATTDRVRPDWHQKLAGARAHAARRSAAATALHTAAYLMGNRGHEPDGRGFGAFGRRALLRRGGGQDSSASHLSMLALMSERYGRVDEDDENGASRSRRVRAEDLDEMMMMEAIRLSIATEEERRKKEEKEARKDAKKDAKKQEKENKKAEKAAKKGRSYTGSASQSTTDLASPQSQSSWNDPTPTSAGKGKGIQQSDIPVDGPSSGFAVSNPSYTNTTASAQDSAQQHLEQARAHIQPEAYGSSPYKPSHLRNLSYASSTDDESASESLRAGFHGSQTSFDASPAGSGMNLPAGEASDSDQVSATPPGGGTGLEPMFNFGSLAAMVGDDHQDATAGHAEAVEVPQDAVASGTPTAFGSEEAASVSRNASTKTTNESFHDASESMYPTPPQVNITAPSRTNSSQVGVSDENKVPVSRDEFVDGSSTGFAS